CDHNIFSELKKNNTPKFQKLNESIIKYKKNLAFCFSHAHIRDKRNDTTNLKYQDFNFIETIVGNNYLSYHGLDKRSSFYLATPTEVFNDEPVNENPIFDYLETNYKQVRKLIESN